MAVLVALVLILLARTAHAGSRVGDLVGWEGESYDPVKIWGSRHMHPKDKEHLLQDDEIVKKADSEGTRNGQKMITDDVKCPEAKGKVEEKRERWVEQLSWEPRAFIFHGFLTDEECDHVIKLARPLVKRSTVITDKSDDEVDNIRTSFGAFIPHMIDDVITNIERKVENWTYLPMTNFEYMNVLRYGYGQKYGGHIDTFEEGEPRVATVLMYLSDIQEGGETAFPHSNNWLDPSLQKKFGPFSECADGHVAVKPKKGDALLFYSLKPNGEVDESSFHTGCPVLAGIKWTSTIWIHTGPLKKDGMIETEPLDSDPGLCVDGEKQCGDWAAKGGCKTEKSFMSSYCRRTCKLCKICEAGDHECYNQNRVDAGFPRIEDVP